MYVGAAVIARYAVQMGCHVSWEWSERCEAWRFPWIQKMLRDLEMTTVVTHGCRVGLRSLKDRKKGWKVATTHTRLAEQLPCQCKCGPHCQHGRCEGRDAEASARYTPEFAKRVARAMCFELSHHQVTAECSGKSVLPALFGLGSACQCEETCFKQHERQCGHCVCHDSMFPCEAKGEEQEARHSVDEPADTPETEAATWTQEEMVVVERFAKEFCKQERFDFSACEELIARLPHGKTARRSSAQTSGDGQCDVFGLYAYGSQVGVTRRARDFPETMRYLTRFLSHQRGSRHQWTSVVVNRGYSLKAHRDVNNLDSQPNVLLAWGTTLGGGGGDMGSRKREGQRNGLGQQCGADAVLPRGRTGRKTVGACVSHPTPGDCVSPQGMAQHGAVDWP